MMNRKIDVTALLGMLLMAVMMLCGGQETAARRNVVAVPKSEVRTLPIAHNLVVDGPFVVELTGGVEPGRVEIESDSLFLPYIETEVSNFTMTIRVAKNKPKKVVQTIPVRIRIHVDWLSVAASHGAELRCEEMLQAGDMVVLLSGAMLKANMMCMTLKMDCKNHSVFDGNIESSFVDLTIEEQSEFHAYGTIQKLLAYCTTGSDLNIMKMACNDIYLQCYNGSKAKVQVIDVLHVTAHDDSSVVYVGDCKIDLRDETPESVVQRYK